MGDLLTINASRLLCRLDELSRLGATPEGGVSRLALSNEDKLGRDQVVAWMKEIGLEVHIDRVGNLLGFRPGQTRQAPVLFGSHLDSVRAGGRYDGAYGVLAALEVLQTLQESGLRTRRPLLMAVFTNEEGARYAPDMQGSLAFVGDLPVNEALAATGFDGSNFGAELQRIGYAGDFPCASIRPHACLELHIEQGPVLEKEGIRIGAVEAITGISWQEVTLKGVANHAGTTPMDLRHDAGFVAACIVARLRHLAAELGPAQRATCGMISFRPNVINVIPAEVTLTLDLRNPDEGLLRQAEERLREFIERAAAEEGVTVTSRQLAYVSPARCDPRLVAVIEAVAADLHLSCRRMVSGAGHDAQILARHFPTAMIFIPSRGGISHSPAEYSSPEDLAAGANVLLQAVVRLAQ
ncbi:MAG: Zn-dependent hydrolase [Anaerolineales bacterium]